MLQYRRYRLPGFLLQALLVCCGLVFIGADSPEQKRFPVPPALQKKLNGFQQKDDLTSWVYAQIQYVTEAPASRADLLSEAITTPWRLPKNEEEQQAWLDLLMNDGHAQLLSGNIVASTDAYRNALLWAGAHSAFTDDETVLEYILKPLGNNYTRLGDYEQATFIQQKALKTALALHSANAIAAAYSNIATTASSMGKPEQSVEYCRQGLKYATGSSSLYGLLLCEQADAWFVLQQFDSAKYNIGKGIAILEKFKDREPATAWWLFMAYQQAGDMYVAKPSIALSFLNKALALQQQLVQAHGNIRVRERAKLFYRLGNLNAKQHQYTQASAWLQQCLQLLMPGTTLQSINQEDVYGENTLVDALFAQASIFAQQQEHGKALQLYSICFSAEKKLRHEYITKGSQQRAVAGSRQRYETAIETAYQAYSQTKKADYRKYVLEFMESGKAQLLLEEVQWKQFASGNTIPDSIARRVQLLEKALIYYERTARENGKGVDSATEEQRKKAEWELATLKKKYLNQSESNNKERAIVANPEKIIETVLGKERVIRSYFAGERAAYCIEADNADITFLEKLGYDIITTDSIKNFVQRYFHDGPNAMLNYPRQYYQNAYSIYKWLCGNHPFETNKSYVLLPDGVLNLLPVDALVTSPDYVVAIDKWPFVLINSPVSYAYSLQTLWQQYQIPVTGDGMAGFFIANNKNNQVTLSATQKEQENIKELFGNATWYSNEEATVDAFRKALSGNAIIHVSTHALAGKDSADLPHIQLYDNPFYLFELQDQQQHPAMVVLSACQTGDGKMITGEGVQSMARAFIAGGTHAVVAGWWNVHDEAAAGIISDFYLIASERGDAAEALREAKLQWLQRKDVAYLQKLPYYWAALNYNGQPRSLTAGTATANHNRWIWIAIILVPLLLISLVRRKND